MLLGAANCSDAAQMQRPTSNTVDMRVLLPRRASRHVLHIINLTTCFRMGYLYVFIQ